MLFDTHVHFPQLAADEHKIRAVLDRAAAAGVTRLLAVGGSPEANRLAVDIARANPRQVRAAVGINRDQAETAWPVDELMKLISAPETVAIGEIGLDFHLTPRSVMDSMADPVARHGVARPEALRARGQDLPHTVRHYNKISHPVNDQLHHQPESPSRKSQTELFERMLAVARDARLPVIVHSREAEKETLACLEAHARTWAGPKDRIGVQHCFTGSRAYAERLLVLGFYISFSGILTFKNSGELRDIAALIPAERLLIETDSPWLAPEPFRGRPNEPANVRRVAETLAEIRHCPPETVAAAAFRNAENLFRERG